MAVRIISGLVAIALLLAYLLPPALKLKHAALAVVIAIGVVLMLVDLWHSLREKE